MTEAAPEAPMTPTDEHQALHERLDDEVLGYDVTEDGVGVSQIHPMGIFRAASEAKALGFRILSLLSASDDGSESLHVLYSFVKPAATADAFGELRLRVSVPRPGDDVSEPRVQSITGVMPAAGWHEREMFDMYGIQFQGNPDLRRMFLPDGWKGYPMLKDYKEPEQFVALRDGEDVVLADNEEGSW